METITKFIGTREGNDWLNVAVLTCGHEHPGHEKGERLPVGAEVQCGLCEAGDKRPRPHLPTGGTHAAASMTPEARGERARKAAMARHYAHLVPVMVEAQTALRAKKDPPCDAPEILRRHEEFWSMYPSLRELPRDAWVWVVTEARRAMGY